MAHLWVRDAVGAAGGDWAALPLDAPSFVFDGSPARPRRAADAAGARDAPVRLLRSGTGQAARWVLLVGARVAVRVNGTPVWSGILVLADKDEIRVGDASFHFSLETVACVEPFPGSDAVVPCPRCKLELLPPDANQSGLAVRCPRCRVWYHQRDDRPCWRYSSTCRLCEQPTDLDAGFEWTPEL